MQLPSEIEKSTTDWHDTKGCEIRALLCRNLKTGDRVRTGYSGRVTEHTIRDTDKWKPSASGLLFRVYPPVPNSAGSWMDSGWFEPASQPAQGERHKVPCTSQAGTICPQPAYCHANGCKVAQGERQPKPDGQCTNARGCTCVKAIDEVREGCGFWVSDDA